MASKEKMKHFKLEPGMTWIDLLVQILHNELVNLHIGHDLMKIAIDSRHQWDERQKALCFTASVVGGNEMEIAGIYYWELGYGFLYPVPPPLPVSKDVKRLLDLVAVMRREEEARAFA